MYSFDGARGMCEPTKYTIHFTHPRRDLSRSDYIGRMATFVIQPPPATRWSQPDAPQRVQGVITGFAQVASNHEQSVYTVTRVVTNSAPTKSALVLDQLKDTPDISDRRIAALPGVSHPLVAEVRGSLAPEPRRALVADLIRPACSVSVE